MIFQTLDDKTECVGIYADTKLIFDEGSFPEGLSATWKHVPYLRDWDVDYASLYLQGAPLSSVLPEYLREDWEDVASRITAFKRSLGIAGVDTRENCFFDLVPSRFLIEFCEVKNQITKHILTHVEKPRRYDFYRHVSMMLSDIAMHPVEVDHRVLGSYKSMPKLTRQVNSIADGQRLVSYNQFGTKTGRLTTNQGSFPILTLNKALRSAVVPTNDFYVELDFNGAEIRVLLGLMEKPQPRKDVHSFHLEEVFDSKLSRDQAKTAFFAWLYGSRTAVEPAALKKLEAFYDKSYLLPKYWDGSTLVTPFHKRITDVSEHHALNYLIQSTAAELTLKQALKIDHLLRTQGSGSRIAFLIHDAVVLDMKKEDSHLLTFVHELMSSTTLGEFKVNVAHGSSLGTLKVDTTYG